jgi:hypothetical protein
MFVYGKRRLVLIITPMDQNIQNNTLNHHVKCFDNILYFADDKNLPSVPPISVTVPESYPDTSPECDSKLPEYGM